MPDLTEYKTHDLKILPVYFSEVVKENKRFEVRKNDRDFKIGDFLHLKEWDPEKQAYTGQEAICAVRYLLEDPRYLQRGFCIMSIVVLKAKMYQFPGNGLGWTLDDWKEEGHDEKSGDT